MRQRENTRGWQHYLFRLCLLALCGGLWSGSARADPPAPAETTRSMHLWFPCVTHNEGCQPIAGANFGSLPIQAVTAPIPIERNPDFNLTVRGWQATQAYVGLVNYNTPHDPRTPQFDDLFADGRLPAFAGVYQVRDWDWTHNTRGPFLTNPPVTLLGLASRVGETVHVPDSGYRIDPQGYEVLVLYAAPERITLKFTREDHVVWGYTMHLEGLCVEPNLVALYQACDRAGRHSLPALRPHQAFARARGTQVLVAIRDCGTFLDPRSREDWWQGH